MILVWLGAILIGLSLGLLGSGGSILTVPVLVYLVGETHKLAIAESLAIVGGISLLAVLPYTLKKQIHWNSVLWFGIPGVIGTYLGAYLSQWLSGTIQLLLFAVVMLLAAYMMWRAKDLKSDEDLHPIWQIILEGLIVGVVTGLVGVGGGFLIIPALVILGKLPMRLAVGTSLLIIAMKSLSGFIKYLDILQEGQVNWQLIGLFIVLGTIGSFSGSFLSQRIPQQQLRKLFSGVLIGMGIYILYTNLPEVLNRPVNLWLIAGLVIALFMVLLRQNPDKSISVRRLSDLQKEGILVDVREEAEYRSGHASGAINIPLSKLEQSLEKLPKDKPVYLMCRSGSRSRMALNRLQAAGFDNAVNVQGGIMAWQMAELPISKGNLPGVSL